MKLIIDSGSTKTDWCLIDKGGVLETYHSIGINPFFQNTEDILKIIKDLFFNADWTQKVSEIWHYGTGCSSEDKRSIVHKSFKEFFTNASSIQIRHDLEGAAVALFGHGKGIACILGTGANSCVWDGEKVVMNVPSNGYILGDEGSGSYLGREILKVYLNDQMLPDLKSKFEEKFGADKDMFLEETYHNPRANAFLAQFALLIAGNEDHPQIDTILQNGFEDFFRVRIEPYHPYLEFPLGFIGSISYFNLAKLENIAAKHQLHVGKAVRSPMEGLVEFHSTKPCDK